MAPDPVPTVETITSALRNVIDPELGADIVDLGMVNEVTVDEGGSVQIGVALTIAGCPLRAQIRDDIRGRISQMPGVAKVKVSFGEMTQAQRSEVMQRARRRASEAAPDTQVPLTTRILAVASGKGGVGKSSVTVNLAASLAATGLTVGVLDADIWGFSIPRMFGVSGRLGASDDRRIEPHHIDVGRGRVDVVSMGLLVDDEDTAIMWRGLMLAKALEEFLLKVAWDDLDYLLIDMPPGTGDVQMALARLLPRAQLLVVTTPALAAQKVAIRVADMARRSYLSVLGVIENMSAFTCEHGDRYALFGSGGGQELADSLGVPLVGQVPLEPAVSRANDTGTPLATMASGSPAAEVFAAIAGRVVSELAPPLDMAGCSARMLAAAEAAFGG